MNHFETTLTNCPKPPSCAPRFEAALAGRLLAETQQQLETLTTLRSRFRLMVAVNVLLIAGALAMVLKPDWSEHLHQLAFQGSRLTQGHHPGTPFQPVPVQGAIHLPSVEQDQKLLQAYLRDISLPLDQEKSVVLTNSFSGYEFSLPTGQRAVVYTKMPVFLEDMNGVPAQMASGHGPGSSPSSRESVMTTTLSY